MALPRAQQIRSVALRYGLAVVSYGLILLITFAIPRIFSVSLDLTALIIIVMIASAWYGGRGPGLVVAVLFELTIDYFALTAATPAPFTWKFAAFIFNRLLLFTSVVLFASSRRKAEDRLKRQSELLRVTLASIGDAVIATNLDGLINFINPTAEAMTGWTMAECVNQPLDRVFHIVNEETRALVESPFAAIKREGNVVGLANHTILIGKNGRELPIEDSGAPIKDPTGKTFGVIIVFHDVSERRLAEKEREQLLEREQQARSEAEAANRLKDEFLATVSHELRTPLNAILGWAALFNRRTLEAETLRVAMGVIERNARGQAEIINDILDVSRIITGKLRIEPQPVALGPIIQAAIDPLRPAATAKTITLTVTLDQDAGLVSGDPDRLRQIVWNLVSNAIKFTPKDGQIEVRLERIDAHLQIKVSDSGLGIEQPFLPHVFDRFRQADSSTTRTHGGLGLGLAIVRHLVELHGGTVAAASAGEDRGSVFTVTLPLAEAQEALPVDASSVELEPAGAPNGSAASPPDLTGLRVLVVDDDSDNREILSLMLSQYGADVRTASSTADALQAFFEWKPNVLISDLGMPDEDGFALIRKVRALAPEEGGNIPAAALTAYVRAEERLQALSAGYQTHISKPVDPLILAAVVSGLAKRGRNS